MMTAPQIVIVDDDYDVLYMLSEVFRDEGYQAVLWPSGAGAFELIKRTAPVAVILDMNMDGHDSGLDVAEAIRKDPETRNLPVIICSGFIQFVPAIRERLNALRCVVLAKPYEVATILAALEQAKTVSRL